MTVRCGILDLGRKDYQKAYRLQKKLVQERIDDQIDDRLLLVEHNPVFTIGRAGSEENILIDNERLDMEGISVYHIDRGGDVTYHGPGQIVGYPLINLKEKGEKDLHLFLRKIEEVFIRLLAEYGLQAGRKKEYTGVWVGEEKITAIGIGVKSWVTYHGFAFNLNPNLSHFGLINPCGITDRGVTSLAKLLGYTPDWEKVQKQVIKNFAEVFNYECYLV